MVLENPIQDEVPEVEATSSMDVNTSNLTVATVPPVLNQEWDYSTDEEWKSILEDLRNGIVHKH